MSYQAIRDLFGYLVDAANIAQLTVRFPCSQLSNTFGATRKLVGFDRSDKLGYTTLLSGQKDF